MAKRYGLDIVSKTDPTQRCVEWFDSERECRARANELRHWGREFSEREEDYVSREELRDQRSHELAVARASASHVSHSSTASYGGMGLATGLALGLLF